MTGTLVLNDVVRADNSSSARSSADRFFTLSHAHDDRLRKLLASKVSQQPAQSRKMRELQLAVDEAQQQIERLTARNQQLLLQLEHAWQREADALAHSHRDELTGLPNRRLLKDRLQGAIARADRDSKSVALLLIDMDDFKQINDTLGHAAGDQLLCQVAQRLGECLRAVDTACRYGGDEFVVVFSDLGGPESVDAVISKVRECLLAPYQLAGVEMNVSASIGKSVYPSQAGTDQELIGMADADMYAIKAQRHGRRS